jgi:hypothetical protein
MYQKKELSINEVSFTRVPDGGFIVSTELCNVCRSQDCQSCNNYFTEFDLEKLKKDKTFINADLDERIYYFGEESDDE